MSTADSYNSRSMTVIACLWALLGVANIIMWARSHERPAYEISSGVGYVGLAIGFLVLRAVRRAAP
jgi:ABC-type uncharacterized transport system permease subunit